MRLIANAWSSQAPVRLMVGDYACASQLAGLPEEEFQFILGHKSYEDGLARSPCDYTDAKAQATIAQIGRILEGNGLRAITEEVIEIVSGEVVIGPLN